MVNYGVACFQAATGRNKEKRHDQDRTVAAATGGRKTQRQVVVNFDVQLIKRFLQNNFFRRIQTPAKTNPE